MIHLVTYDLHKPDRDYPAVIAKIKSFGSWAHDEESVWLVDALKSTATCRDELSSVSEDATYFVVRITKDWASRNVDKDVVEWLNSPSRRWG